jgi:hypothetical protein
MFKIPVAKPHKDIAQIRARLRSLLLM